MLYITRRIGERVWVGDVMVEVVNIDRGIVRLAFKGPDGTLILREELRDKSIAVREKSSAGRLIVTETD